MRKVHPKVEEAVDTLDLNPVTRRRLIAGSGLASASLAATALLGACGKNTTQATGASGNFPKTPKWKFVFVCHVTTNPFFTPTQYGAEDACKLLGADFQWTGSKDSIVAEMVNATRTAITGKADGLALAVVDKDAFRAPVDQALDAGIPVVSYNADVTKGLSIIDAYAQGHPNLAGMLAVDAGSTQAVGQTVGKYNMRSKGLKVAGGFDLVPETLNGIKAGNLDYTIDQQPYLQGFLPVLALYFYKLSGGLLFPCQTNTGLLFVTKDSVGPYQTTKSRYEGSATDKKLVERSGAIPHS